MGRFTARLMMLAAIFVAGVIVSACGGTDVELKGGLFDVLGVSGNTNAGGKEPKMANRPGLVIPPSTASLPAPGTAAAPPTALAANGEAFPVNPEDMKNVDGAEILARHNAFCEKARHRQKIGITTVVEKSPWGPCDKSVLRNLMGKDLAGNKAVTGQ